MTAPERIWAGRYHGTWWQSTPHHQMTEYIRADLPPTLEQVKALPEIKALVEAAKGVVDGWDWWTEDQFDRCQSVPADAIEDARAALRAIGEGGE